MKGMILGLLAHCVAKCRWLIITPLLDPVVPDVYMITAKPCGAGGTASTTVLQLSTNWSVERTCTPSNFVCIPCGVT